jgi:chemotaxis protein methyltransferase CheR
MLEEHAGVALSADQDRFVAGRLHPVALRNGLAGLEPLVSRMRDRSDRNLMREVVESLVTHETSFFRDSHYFDELADRVLPQLIARHAAERRLSIWCAACSTGQEPYSIAMLLRERFAHQLSDWNVDLLATDLSAAALQQAKSGCYSDVEVRRGVSDVRLSQHFRRAETGWQIDDRLKQSVRFQQLNLLSTWPVMAAVDLILVRNVLVYMNPTTRQAVLNRMRQTLHPDGYLMLGCSESASIPNLQIVTGRVEV